MSKKNKKKNKLNPSLIIGDKADPVKVIDDFVGKKGKIGKKNKGKNKFMRGLCPHHRIGKKGYPKPAVWKNADETATCKICGKKMSTVPYEDHEVKKAVDRIAYINEQQKFMATACNTDKKMRNYFSEMGVLLEFYPKNSKNLAKVARQQNKSKKKKKDVGSSSSYGSWGTRR